MATNLRKKYKNQIAEARNSKAKVKLGKKGITDATLKEISDQLQQHLIIKVRFLPNYLTDDLDADIQKIAKKTKAQLVEKRGKTIILYKPKIQQ